MKERNTSANKHPKSFEVSEHHFRNILMQAPVGFVILRGEEMIVEMANNAYLQIVDRKKEDFEGKSLYESMPEVKEKVSPILLNILKTGEPFYGNEFEVTLNRFGKKEQAFFNFVYSALRENDNTITGVIAVATEVTVQVRHKIELEQKDAQFRKLVCHSPIAMAIFRGQDLVIELANKALLKNIWRKEWSAVKGKKLEDVFPELHEQSFPGLLRAVLKNGEVYTQSEAFAVVNSEDGSKQFYFDLEYSPLREADGLVTGIMVTVNDITEKVRTKKIREVAEKKYRDLIEILPVAVFTVDAEGYLDLYNQAAIELWKRTPVKGVDKWCGSHGLYTINKVYVPHADCPMTIAVRENRAVVTEAYVQRPDGELRHVIAHPQPLHDEFGIVVGAMNVLIDITARKEAEIALLTSEEKFRLLANSMPQFIWTANAAGELNYFSQSVFDYSGFTEKTILKGGWLEIVHPEERESNITSWMESVNTGNDFHFEHRFRRHDGAYRWQLSRAMAQKDANGQIQMWVGTSTDIHDKRLFLDALTREVNERTRALTTTNENLLRSNAELAQFAYVASHDLQEPLRKMQAFISRIMELDYENLSAKSKDYFNIVNKSSKRTQLLIRDILSFSRANASEKSFELTDLNKLLTRVMEDLPEARNQKQVVITNGILPTVPVVDFQFEQLFTNLLANAIKFADSHRSCIIHIDATIVAGHTIEGAAATAHEKYHLISFNDNGIGFEPQYSDRIFLVFQRLHPKESYEGTGIGLAICKRIVEDHHGFITATGKPGEGATFNIYLPA